MLILLRDINNLNLDLEEGSFDVIVSNCVINLLQNKDKIFNTIFKLLKEGGEFYFSDVYSDRRINQDLKNNNVLWGSVYLVPYIGMIS